ncbi:MAG: hypothetical protein IJY11_01850 [Clostridia bacterium]|nr:hypothetical protein [Clostridia bacterium]
MAEKKISSKTYLVKRHVFDAFSLGKADGCFCATSSYGCKAKGGILAYGTGMRYLSINGVDLISPEPLLDFSFAPYNTSIGRISLPILSTTQGVYYLAEPLKDFEKVITTGNRVKLLSLPGEDGYMRLACVLRNALWRFGIGCWFSKMCDGTFSKAACVFENRLFVVGADDKLQYSAPYAYADFTDSADEGGFVRLMEYVSTPTQLVALKEEMYCFCNEGLYRVTGGSAARDFKVEKVDYVGGVIYEGSAAACGDRVLFMTPDGLFGVKNGKVQPMDTHGQLKGVVPYPSAEAAATGNKYFLPCTLYGENRTLTVDLSTGECAYTQFSSVLCSFDGGVYGADENRRLFAYAAGYPLPSAPFFERKGESFGDEKDKTLTSVKLYGSGKITLRVVGRNGSREKQVQLTKEGTIVPIALKGKRFDVRITLSLDAQVTGLEAETQRLYR